MARLVTTSRARASMLENRLTHHVLGNAEMSATRDPSNAARERTRKLKASVEHWWRLLQTAGHKLEILDTLIGRLTGCTGIHEGAASGTASLLVHTLLFDLIKDLAALTSDDGKKAPSLVNIQKMLGDKDVQQALRLAGMLTPEDYAIYGVAEDQKKELAARLAHADAQDDGAQFDAELPRVIERLTEILSREVVRKVKTARDKTIAHFETVMTDAGRELFRIDDVELKWGDPKALFADLEDFGYDLVMVALQRHYDRGERRRIDRVNAQELWRALGQL